MEMNVFKNLKNINVKQAALMAIGIQISDTTCSGG